MLSSKMNSPNLPEKVCFLFCWQPMGIVIFHVKYEEFGTVFQFLNSSHQFPIFFAFNKFTGQCNIFIQPLRSLYPICLQVQLSNIYFCYFSCFHSLFVDYGERRVETVLIHNHLKGWKIHFLHAKTLQSSHQEWQQVCMECGKTKDQT